MPADDLGSLPAYRTSGESAETEVIEAELVHEEPSGDTGIIEVEPERRRSALPGVIALLAALVVPVLAGIAVGAATDGDAAGGTVLGWLAIWFSVGAVLLGLVAVLFRMGRVWGAIAIVVGALANPWLQLQLLRWLGGA